MRQSGAAPTSATRLKETIGFVKAIVGWDVDSEVLESRRVSGVAVAMMKAMGPVKRAPPLPPDFVAFLEKQVVDDARDLEFKYLCGMILFLVFTRSRFSDAMRIPKEPVLVDGVLVTDVLKYKTAGARERRGLALPVCGLAAGLNGPGWADAFLETRRQIGVVASPVSPFFPSLKGGKPMKSAVGLEECTAVIRRFLRTFDPGMEESQVATYSTHSCKRTMLFWAAVDGLSLDNRRLLGGHVLRSDGSWLAYSVEALAAPLRELSKTVGKVKNGSLLKMVENQEGQSESSSSSTDLSSGAETKQMLSAVASVSSSSKHGAEQDLTGFELYRHHKYGTVHLRQVGATTLHAQFLCGRKLGPAYSACGHNADDLFPKCSVCYAKV